MSVRDFGFDCRDCATGADIAALACIIDKAYEPILVLDEGGHLLYSNPAARCITLSLDRPDVRLALRDTVTRAGCALVTDGGNCSLAVSGFSGSARVARIGSASVTRFLLYLAPGREANAEGDSAASQRARVAAEATAALAHELNQPLTALANYASAATAACAMPQHGSLVPHEFILKAAQQAARAAEIARKIRAYVQSRIDDRMPLDLRDAVCAGVDLAKSQVGFAVTLDLPHRELIVLGDRTALEQVVANLVRNAAQSVARRRRREGRLCEPGWLRVAAWARNGRVCLAVEDNGVGLPLDFSLDGGAATAPSGDRDSMGLGLTISRRVIEGHGGTLRLQSRSAGGASAMVDLPCIADDDLLAGRAAA